MRYLFIRWEPGRRWGWILSINETTYTKEISFWLGPGPRLQIYIDRKNALSWI